MNECYIYKSTYLKNILLKFRPKRERSQCEEKPKRDGFIKVKL